jgi:hypothetical protein
MSNFTPLVTREYEFEGDKISMTFSRLKRKHMLGAMPALKTMRDLQDESASDDRMQTAMGDVLTAIVDHVPDYVTEFKGLTDENGNPISIETVCNEFYFMALSAQICNDVLQASTGTEGKV